MIEKPETFEDAAVVRWLRQVSPYFQNHRNKTVVVHFAGAAVAEPGFANLISDLVLLAAVGMRLVAVFGARPQIEERFAARGLESKFVGGLRVCDREAMAEVTEVVGGMRLTIESAFSFGSRGGPFASAASKLAGGNFVLAKPVGIIDGVDLGFTGLVRKVDRAAIESRLHHGEIVLLAPLGYAPTGELFNLDAEDLAAEVAGQIGAAKLVLVAGTDGITSTAGHLCRQLTVREALDLRATKSAADEESSLLDTAVSACRAGVERVHIVNRHVDGAVLRELFTRDGIGTLISSAPFDHLRQAVVEDVAGILELIKPLETRGVLVERSRERLEADIAHFVVMVREGTIVACGALYPYAGQAAGEVASIAVHPDYRGGQFGDVLLEEIEQRAREREIGTLFVLTTQTAQWFNERGFDTCTLESLPIEKRERYDYQRNSAVLVKRLA